MLVLVLEATARRLKHDLVRKLLGVTGLTSSAAELVRARLIVAAEGVAVAGSYSRVDSEPLLVGYGAACWLGGSGVVF